jgi:glycosyltransferase involved in cell wall biosynthesis
MSVPRITVSMPCYGRPQRTLRSIECIVNQNITGWEAFIMGDACPNFQKLIDNGYLEELKIQEAHRGNIIHYFNAEENGGGCGYQLTNYAIQNATGKYLVFYANDDVILPNHFENYLEIEKTSYDFMYFNSWVDVWNKQRTALLGNSQIGHSEIILKTELAKKLPPHGKHYGHDWDFIYNMTKQGKGGKSNSRELTYRVMSIPGQGTKDTID